MLRKTTAALASLSLVMAAAPALAQSAPQPAVETSLGSEGESAQFGGGNILGYALLAAFGVASVWALIEIMDDDDGDDIPVLIVPGDRWQERCSAGRSPAERPWFPSTGENGSLRPDRGPPFADASSAHLQAISHPFGPAPRRRLAPDSAVRPNEFGG